MFSKIECAVTVLRSKGVTILRRKFNQSDFALYYKNVCAYDKFDFNFLRGSEYIFSFFSLKLRLVYA